VLATPNNTPNFDEFDGAGHFSDELRQPVVQFPLLSHESYFILFRYACYLA